MSPPKHIPYKMSMFACTQHKGLVMKLPLFLLSSVVDAKVNQWFWHRPCATVNMSAFVWKLDNNVFVVQSAWVWKIKMSRKVLWHLLLIFLCYPAFKYSPPPFLYFLTLFPVLKVYVFEVAGAAISVVAVPGADQMWQAGASVMLSLSGERNLQGSQNTQVTLLIIKWYYYFI